MDTEIMVEPLPLLGTCNLCLSEGAVKSMLIAYKNNRNDEIYSEMLMKCFAIDITMLHLGDMKKLICGRCISKLRESLKFRELVDTSLKTLELKYQTIQQVKKEILDVNNIYPSDVDLPDEVGYDDNHDDDDRDADIPLINMAIKKEPAAEYLTVKHNRKKITNKPNRHLKIIVKKLDINETEAMLQSGLFPFKTHQNKKFSCAVCSMKSTNLDDIRKHVIVHNKKTIHIAFLNMKFSKSQQFYKVSRKLRCKLCTLDLSNYEEVHHHIENCVRLKYNSKNCKMNSLPFKLEKDQLDCPICKKTFLNFVSLNTHMNIHYPNYICENCGKAFASTARLRGHIRTHEIGEFPCKYCDAVFDRVTKRENHVSKEHKAGVRYACKRCNISLPSFYARQKHLAEVHNEELKRYKCKVCPQSYITPGHLSSHVRRDHLNERNHKCDKCDLAFYTKNALKMHMIKHDGERIHSCNICQKSYQRKKTLREHMRIHDNDKRFVCPVCGRAFTQKCTLKGHLKVHERKIDLDDSMVQSI